VQLLRPVNLLFIVLTHTLVVLCLLEVEQGLKNLFPFVLLCFSTCCVAAGGYVVNDIHDQAIDLINKPQKMYVGKTVTEQTAWRIYRFLSVLGFTCSVLLGVEIFLLHLTCGLILYLYASHLKKTFFWGNFSVALLSALAVLIPVFLKPTYNLFATALVFSVSFAFLFSFIREVAKDLEDQKGDKAENCKTFAIVLGNEKTKKIIAYLWIFSALLALYFAIIFSLIWLKVYAIFLTLVCLLLAFASTKMQEKKHFAQLSLACKMLMLSGILAIAINLTS
jgi:4-hydroxybenzoate polyprenyltransferase